MSNDKKPAHEVIIKQLQEFNQIGAPAVRNLHSRGGITMLTTVLCRMVIPAEDVEAVVSSLRLMTDIFEEKAMSNMEKAIRSQ